MNTTYVSPWSYRIATSRNLGSYTITKNIPLKNVKILQGVTSLNTSSMGILLNSNKISDLINTLTITTMDLP